MNILDMTKKKRGRVIIAVALVLCIVAGTVIGCSVTNNDESKDNPDDKQAENTDIIAYDELSDFLTDEQIAVYETARDLYGLFVANPAGVETLHFDGSFSDSEGSYTIGNFNYVAARGKYQNYPAFRDLCLTAFTEAYYDEINLTGTDSAAFIERDNRLYYRDTALGGEFGHDIDEHPDTYELISRTNTEIRFNVVGYYKNSGGGDRIYTLSKCAQPITMVLTENGWRFSLFADTAHVDMGLKEEKVADYYFGKNSIAELTELSVTYQGEEILLGDWFEKNEMNPYKYAILGLDDDNGREMVFGLAKGPNNENTDVGSLILHSYDFDDTVYACLLYTREFGDLKADGTFHCSGNVSDMGICYLDFSGDSGYQVYLARRASLNGGLAQSSADLTYEIGGNIVSEAEFQAYLTEQNQKPSPVWYEMSKITTQISTSDQYTVFAEWIANAFANNKPDPSYIQTQIEQGEWVCQSENNIAVIIPESPVKIMISEDSGESWRESIVTDSDKMDIYGEAYGDFQYRGGYIGTYGEKGGYLILRGGVAMNYQPMRIYLTSDGGSTWKEIGNPMDVHVSVLSGAGFSSESIGFISYRYFADNGPDIWWTKDGGNTWSMLEVTLPNEYQAENYRFTPQTPVFTGDEGVYPILVHNTDDNEETTIYMYSHDGGLNWNFRSDSSTAAINGSQSISHSVVITDIEDYKQLGNNFYNSFYECTKAILSGDTETLDNMGPKYATGTFEEYKNLKFGEYSIYYDDKVNAFVFDAEVINGIDEIPAGQRRFVYQEYPAGTLVLLKTENTLSTEASELLSELLNLSMGYDLDELDKTEYIIGCLYKKTGRQTFTREEISEYAETVFGITDFEPDSQFYKDGQYSGLPHGGTRIMHDIVSIEENPDDGIITLTVRFYADFGKTIYSHLVSYQMTKSGDDYIFLGQEMLEERALQPKRHAT